MTSAIQTLAALHVGTVESVAPDSISVLIDTEAPQTTALNTGVPTAFPRLNGYVVIPKEGGSLVGLVVWLGIDRSPRPTRRTSAPPELGLVDLPFPLRRMELAPVGTLRHGFGDSGDSYVLERGVAIFPSVGDQVLMPSRGQLRAIVEPEGEERRVHIGTAVLAASARVSVDPDRLFGRHLAVLGNTGSGKSCTVAGLIRWSIQAASQARPSKDTPNARFLILDPNGEYGRAFDDLPGGVRRFQVPPLPEGIEGVDELVVPAWMWNGHEWSAFAAASARVQRPILMQALRDLRAAGPVGDTAARTEASMWQKLGQWADFVRAKLQQGPVAQANTADRISLGQRLEGIVRDATQYASRLVRPEGKDALSRLAADVDKAVKARKSGDFFGTLSDSELDGIVQNLETAQAAFPAPARPGIESEDAPIPFDTSELVERLEVLSQDQRAGQAAAFLSTLILRVRTMLADRRMGPIVSPSKSPTFADWLTDYIGADQAANGAVGIIDLSLVPSNVVHIVVAVLSRLVFEATQRYRRAHGTQIPTVIVLEEAHTFVQRFDGNDDDVPSPAQMCRRTFERIAREGRKFGLGLLLSSQRPSELSPTVLAQCNTFVLHRLVNDRDQDLVRRLVPDNLAGLLRELPTLPTRHALLLGWATPLPVLMEVRELEQAKRPASADPSFWNVWIGKESRPIDWTQIANDWVTSASVTGDGAGDDE